MNLIPELVVGISLTGSFVLVIVVIIGEFQRRAAKLQRQAELSRHILERFGSAQELTAFLQTEAGHRLLDPAPKSPSNPKRRIIASVESGLILGLLGLAFLYLAAVHERQAIWAALFLLGLSAGLLLSAYVGYVLSRKWGIFNGVEKR
jgi:hypothetical protein